MKLTGESGCKVDCLAKRQAFIQDLTNEKVTIPIDGLPNWRPNRTVGYDVYFTTWAAIPDSFRDRFAQDYGKTFSTLVGMDQEGNLVNVVITHPDMPLNTLSDKKISLLSFSGLVRALTNLDRSFFFETELIVLNSSASPAFMVIEP